MTDEMEEDDVFEGRVKIPQVFKSDDRLGVKRTAPEKDLVRFHVWNTLTPCMNEECPIYDDCPHEEKKKRGGKCKVEQGYINSTAAMVYRTFRDRFTEDQFFIVGMHILPMYRHLCRMKIWEWAVREVMYEDEKGRRHLNPIYREIREQIKAISAQWRMLGVGQFQIVEPKNPWGSAGRPPVDDRAYYDRLGEIEKPDEPMFARNNKKILRMRRGQ
jgi:hypothetical protein